MNLQTLRILKVARALIAQGWTQNALARDANGVRLVGGDTRETDQAKGTPCAWCAWGAICHAWWNVNPYAEKWPDSVREAALAALRDAAGGWASAGDWNDAPDRTQADVIAAYDLAILKGERDALRARLVECADYAATFFEEGREHRAVRDADATLEAIEA